MSKETKKHDVGSNVKTFNDPGNVLIVVYIMIIIFLLVVGNLANASDEDRIEKDGMSSKNTLHSVEMLIKAE
jgi:hypothetical protein